MATLLSIKKFPIIHLLKNDNRIYALRTDKQFYRAGYDLLGIFKDSIVIDSQGNYYLITEAVKRKWGTWLWGFNPMVKGRIVIVDFLINDSKRISLEELKELILSQLEHKPIPSFWYNQSNISSLKSRVEQAATYEEMINIFVYG